MRAIARASFAAVIAAAAAFAGAQTDDGVFAAGLKPGARVTVDIAGYKYQATFKSYAACNDGGPRCADVTNDEGQPRNLRLRYLRPPVAGAQQAAVLAKTTKPVGKFNCYFFSGYLQTIPGFTLADGGRFSDHVGSGTWTWDAATGTIAFKGGAWNGQKVRTTADGRLQVLKANGEAGATTCSKSK